MEKKRIAILTIVIFLVGIIITAGSYAFWSWSSTQNKNIVFNTSNNLKNYVVYNEGESQFAGELNVSNSYLTGGIHSTISIYKTTDISLLATIHMDVKTIGNEMKKSKALKWLVTEGTASNVGSALAQGNFIGTNAGDTLTLVPDIPVTTTETFYTIWIWIDSSENPSSNLSGEAFDSNVWTEINQVYGAEDRYEITRIGANYQTISATVVDNKYKVTQYAVTTTSSTPSTWTTITPATDQAKVYNLNTSVGATGTYYVWFKDENGRIVTPKSVQVTTVDTSAPICTFGTFNPSQIQNNETSQISLTCTDSESGISVHNLTTSDITVSNDKVTVTNITKATTNNGYSYTITVTGTPNDGTAKLTLSANLVKNGMGLGNASVESGNITVANTYTVTYQTGNNNCPLDSTIYAVKTATYGTAYNIANPSCSGYTFTGWTANSGLDTTNARYGTGSANTAWTNASTPVKGTTVTYFNNLALTSTKAVTLTANWSANELTFNNQTLNTGTYGTAYTSNAFTGASGGTGNYKYEIVSGAPSSGATINGTNGTSRTISFTNYANAGTYSVVVKVTDLTSSKTKNATMTIVMNKKTLSLGTYSATYNGTTSYARTLSTGVGSETLALTYTSYVKNAANYTYSATAGSGKYTVAAANGTGLSSNYTINSGDTFTISKKSLTISAYNTSWVSGNSTYARSNYETGVNSEKITLTYNPYANTAGTYTYATSAASGKFTLTLSDSTNYSIGSAGDFTLGKVAATCPSTVTSYSGQYDGSAHTISVSNDAVGGTVQYSTDMTNWSNTPTTYTNNTSGYKYINIRVNPDGNHTEATCPAGSVTIGPKSLELSAYSVTYTGGTSFSRTYETGIGSETIIVTYTTYSKDATYYGYSAGSTTTSGKYIVSTTNGTGTATNYNIIYGENLTINPKALTSTQIPAFSTPWVSGVNSYYTSINTGINNETLGLTYFPYTNQVGTYTYATSAASGKFTITYSNNNYTISSAGNLTLIDNIAPTTIIGGGTALKATSQSLTLKCSDSVGVTAYYFGTTDPTQASDVSTTTAANITALTSSSGWTQNISSEGTYYLACKDAAGNFSKSSIKIIKYQVQAVLEKITGNSKTTYTSTYYETSGSANTYYVKYGTTLTLSELYTTPTGEDEFKGYSTSAPSSSNCTLTNTNPPSPSENTTVYYMWFTRLRYTVTVTKNTNGKTVASTAIQENNSVTVNAGASSNGTLTVKYGDTVTATATPNTGYSFTGWSGGYISGTDNPKTGGTVTENKIVTAAFTGNEYTATFKYQSNATSGSQTISTLTESCTVSNASGNCTITIPNAVISSVGTYNNEYAGLASNYGTMNTSVSKTATTITLSANQTYYPTYSSPITFYYPNTESTCTSSSNYYRNQWFSGASSMANSVISDSATGTSNFDIASSILATSVTDYGFYGLSNSGGGVSNGELYTYASSAHSNLYVALSSTVTGTFYYNSSTAGDGTYTVATATADAVKKLYCNNDNTSAAVMDSNYTVPTAVANSVGPYGQSKISRWRLATNSMTTSVASTSYSKFFSIYVEPVTNYYYNSGNYTSRTLYRHSYFPSENGTTSETTINTVIGIYDGSISNYPTAEGPGNSTWYGLATTATTTRQYASVDAAAHSNVTTLYTIYKFNVNYNKGSNVSSIGANNGECFVTTSDTSCNVTLPSITSNAGYSSVGWNTTNGATTGTAAGSSYTISTNNTDLYANAIASQLTFADKTITKSFSTSNQTETNGVNAASNGSGTYTYAITGGNSNNYFSLSGRNLTIAGNTPVNTTGYAITITATDEETGATKAATYTIKINKVAATCPSTITAYSGEYDGSAHTISVSNNAAGGTVKYSTDGSTWVNSPTTYTNFTNGAKTIQIKVVADTNHTDVTCNSSTVTISKKALTSTQITAYSTEWVDGNTNYTRSVSTGVGSETVSLTYTPYANTVGEYAYATTGASGKFTLSQSNTNYSISSAGNLTLTPAACNAPTNVEISSAGIVTWTASSNATAYQIGMTSSPSTTATSGVNYLDEITASAGSRTVYVRSVCGGNYAANSSNATATTTVNTVTIAASSNGTTTINNKNSAGAYSAAAKSTNVITGGTAYIYAIANAGYHFGSWSIASGTGTLTNTSNDVTTVTDITSDVTLNSSFIANSVTLTLNKDGEECTTCNGYTVNISTSSTNNTASWSGTTTASSALTISGAMSSSTTYYVWVGKDEEHKSTMAYSGVSFTGGSGVEQEIDFYTVMIDRNNTSYGTTSKSSFVVLSGQTMTASGTTLTVAGISVTATAADTAKGFVNWTRGSVNGTVVSSTALSITSAETIYANFAALSLSTTVGAVSAGINTSNVDVTSYAYLIQTTDTCPSSGYTPSDSSAYVFDIAANGTYYVCAKTVGPDSNIMKASILACTTGYTLTDGVCVSNARTLTADATGGVIPATTGWTVATGGATATKSVLYNTNYGELPIPTKEGHTFIGWYTAETGGTEVTSSTTVTSNIDHTIYAHWTQPPFYQMMHSTAVMDNVASTYVSASTGVNFNAKSSNTNGKGIYIYAATQNDNFPVHYYRGEVSNNYVLFAGYCWKIMRTTETGGTRLIYWGVASNDQCSTTSGSVGNFQFNSGTASYLAGYMYQTTDDGPMNDSSIKTGIDTWYSDNMTGFTNYLDDAVYCNDREHVGTWSSPNNGEFQGWERTHRTHVPSLGCAQQADAFTVNDTTNGNGLLTYPIGLPTVDEVVLAGLKEDTSNSTCYIAGTVFYTMTPLKVASNSPYIYYVSASGVLNYNGYNTAYRTTKPVITLKPEIGYIDGTGTATDPFVVTRGSGPAPTYTVNVNANGGTIPATTGWTVDDGSASAYKTATYGTTYGTLPTPTKTGYVFNGWTNTLNYGDLTITANSSNNYAYYRIYENIKPGVTYNVTMSSATLTTGSQTAFTTVIYDFTTSSVVINPGNVNFGSNISYDITVPDTADRTHDLALLVYAGVSGSTAGNVATFTNIKVKTTSDSIDTAYTASSIVSNNGNHDLVAQWTPKTIQVTFNCGGGTQVSGATNPVTYTYGATKPSFPGDNICTRTGYNGDRWSRPDGGTHSWTSNVTDNWVNNVYDNIYGNTDHNITLTATWTGKSYTVNYYLGNGTSTAGTSKLGSSTCTFGTNCTLTTFADLGGIFPYSSAANTANGQTNYYWVFYGWSTSQTGTTRAHTNGATNVNPATYSSTYNLYAIGSRSIHFNSGNAPKARLASIAQYWNPYSTSTSYVTGVTAPTQTAISGWTFLGYIAGSNAASNGNVTFAASTVGTSVKPSPIASNTYRSKYSRTLTVNYNKNGGSGTMTASTLTQYYNSGYGNAAGDTNTGSTLGAHSITLKSNTFTYTGHSFSKWAEGSASGTKYAAGASYTALGASITGATVTKTMYATWLQSCDSSQWYTAYNTCTSNCQGTGSNGQERYCSQRVSGGTTYYICQNCP